jgi:uncharacterized protein YgiM (DUF1202 family)
MTNKILISTTIAGLVFASSAFAETTATASTDLNLRAGPNTTYQVISVIPGAGKVLVNGCIETSYWCLVTYDDMQGWASGDYLTTMVAAPISGNSGNLALETVTYEPDPSNPLGGGAVGAIAGAVIAGPVGAIIGAALGIGTEVAVTPTEEMTTYVRTNPVEPVYLDGEVVVGAGLPETVILSELPNSEYSYAHVNGVPVLVEAENRRVVHIIR